MELQIEQTSFRLRSDLGLHCSRFLSQYLVSLITKIEVMHSLLSLGSVIIYGADVNFPTDRSSEIGFLQSTSEHQYLGI